MKIDFSLRGRAPRGAPRVALTTLIAVALTLVVTSFALAHAVVYPRTSKAGGYEKYVLRVPNEKATPTLRVEIRFPAGLRVTSFADVPGWQVEVLTDSAKRIVGAVWTGSLPPQRFVELPFVGANPKAATTLTWPVYQTYADGMRVEWTGAEGSKSPASVTSIEDAGSVSSAGPTMRWVPWAALVLALISLGLALRRPAGALG
ncbi:MAG: DUF1775 domain-containing protein [bacterium]